MIVMSYLMGGVKGPHKAMFGNKGCSLALYSGPTRGVFAGSNPRPSQPQSKSKSAVDVFVSIFQKKVFEEHFGVFDVIFDEELPVGLTVSIYVCTDCLRTRMEAEEDVGVSMK